MLTTVLAVSGCRDAPTRITVGSGDTVVINARRSVRLPIHVVGRRGEIEGKHEVRYEVTSGSVLRAFGSDSLLCSGRGDARLRLSLGAVSTSVVVLCRPIIAVQVLPHIIDMALTDKPQELTIGGFDERWQPVAEIAIGVTVNDSSVAVVRGGRVHPRAPGWTYLLIDMAGCQVLVNVRVRHPNPAADTARPPWTRDVIPDRRMCGQVL